MQNPVNSEMDFVGRHAEVRIPARVSSNPIAHLAEFRAKMRGSGEPFVIVEGLRKARILDGIHQCRIRPAAGFG